MPKVDFLVIIPTHNRVIPLRAAIGSADAQTGVSKTIIVADDHPEATAHDVVRDFPEAIYMRNPVPTGGWPGRVRNLAFEQSRLMGIEADYVHFLDDDDTAPPNHYATIKQTFMEHPNIGVVFGVLRPFCAFSASPEVRQRQELQLQSIRQWRSTATRFPWLYQRLGTRCPRLAKWLLDLHARFGSEMFLCSGGSIRYQSVIEIGGFPDIRITEDFVFFTQAIRRYGGWFLERETAGYGVGDSGAMWNPLDQDDVAKAAHSQEWSAQLTLRQKALKAEMGTARFYISKIAFRLGKKVITSLVIPTLDRRGYFRDLDRLIGLS
ncbi:glycosyltransferase family 2 protein [Rhodopila sp.]|uniref:glycosyltransferase family 2 protein n=1 Tax=Rhodopila sp. TaxID=2480087 RepID=UPI003D115B1E